MFRSNAFGLLLACAILVILGPSGQAQDLKSAYSTPITAPFYLGPPAQYQDCKMLFIVFKTTPDVMKELVPEPLKPDERNLMFLYIGILKVKKPVVFSYHEAGIGGLAKFGDNPGKYAAYMYLDKAGPISAGREIFGFPKKDAQITFKQSGNTVIGEVVRNGTTLIKAKINITKRLDEIPDWPSTPWYNLKIIPSVRKDARPDVMQLTSVLTSGNRKEVHEGYAELEFTSSPTDPLGKIKVEGLMPGQFVVLDMVLGHGEVVHDYLKEQSK